MQRFVAVDAARAASLRHGFGPDDDGSDPATRNPYLYWIAGVDRTFFTNLNLNLQFFERRVRRHRGAATFTDPLARSTALLNGTFDGQREAVSDGISFRVSNRWLNDTLEAEAFAIVNFTHRNGFFRPLLSHALTDHWKVTLGAEIYCGPADTQFGSLKQNRGGFLEVRYGL